MSHDPIPSNRTEPHGPPAVAAAGAGWSWVPIRSLGPRHRPRIAAHLLALEPNDRYLRFGYLASDAQIGKYVDLLDFDQDEVFGIFNRRLELIALAHLAYGVTLRSDGQPTAEFGVSVLARGRRRGFGARLFEHAMLHARNRGVHLLMIYALSENVAMLKIARDAGATVTRHGPEADAWLELPPDTFGSHLGELLGERAAEVDYHWKRQARRASHLLTALTGPRADETPERAPHRAGGRVESPTVEPADSNAADTGIR